MNKKIIEHTVKDWKDKTKYPPVSALSKPYAPNNKETLGGVIIKRNKYLLRMFRELGYKVELYGDAEAPIIVLDGLVKLSAFVHNFNLNFKPTPTEEIEIVETVKINFSNRIGVEFLENFIANYEQENWLEYRKRHSL